MATSIKYYLLFIQVQKVLLCPSELLDRAQTKRIRDPNDMQGHSPTAILFRCGRNIARGNIAGASIEKFKTQFLKF